MYLSYSPKIVRVLISLFGNIFPKPKYNLFLQLCVAPYTIFDFILLQLFNNTL